jgi:hypothetical protein
MANIRIDDELMRMLKEYEAKTGVRAANCVEEAVLRWLTWVAPARLEALRAEKRREVVEEDLKQLHAFDNEQGSIQRPAAGESVSDFWKRVKQPAEMKK